MVNLKCLRYGHKPGEKGNWTDRCVRCGAKI